MMKEYDDYFKEEVKDLVVYHALTFTEEHLAALNAFINMLNDMAAKIEELEEKLNQQS